jgi:hypothetical protein
MATASEAGKGGGRPYLALLDGNMDRTAAPAPEIGSAGTHPCTLSSLLPLPSGTVAPVAPLFW